MSERAKRLFFAAEDLLQRLLEAGLAWRAAFAARWWLRRKSDLRGDLCHCPASLPLHLVHSEGLREGADVVVDFGSNIAGRRRRQVPVSAIAGVAGEIVDGDIVHVKADQMPAFAEHILPRVRGPVVLVTGDSDYGAVGDHQRLLENPKLRHWFAQNCDVPWRHPKLTRIPIGFDNPRFDKAEKRIGFLVEMALGKTAPDPTLSRNDMGDQALLQRIAAGIATRPHGKPLRALCTFHMNQKLVPNLESVPERSEAYELLKDNPACHFPARRLPQEECWRMHGEFAFQVSPRGKGLDCFRTWESLFLGTIPIVRTSTLDPLYRDENLPVVIVQSYREVTLENLARWKAEFESAFTPELHARLSNGYWLDRIRSRTLRGIAAKRNAS